jgi:hypothetical protein
VNREESLVQPTTLLLEHTDNDLYPGSTHAFNAGTIDIAIGIESPNDHTRDSARNDQITAWWCLSIVGTWFKAYIYRRTTKQRSVIGRHRIDSIHLGMWLAGTDVIPLADNAAVTDYHRAYHRIGWSAAGATPRKLQTTLHI